MKPIDYRNENWVHVRDRVTGQRLAVYEAWKRFGPGTTREVAERFGMDLLTFRPRSTELYQLGYLRVEDPNVRACEGRYYAVSEAAALKDFLDRQAAAKGKQLNLKIGA